MKSFFSALGSGAGMVVGIGIGMYIVNSVAKALEKAKTVN